MSRFPRGGRFGILAASAIAGLIGSHALDYTLLIRSNSVRRAVLRATGHGYLQTVIAVAIAAGVLAGAASMLAGYHRGRSNTGAKPGFSDWLRSLGLVQTGGFLLMEFGERLAAGSPVHRYLDLTIYFGLLLQILVAALGAALLVLFDHAGEQIGRARHRRDRLPRPSRSRSSPPTVTLVGRRYARPGLVRGPPILDL